ncbi:hypothetical protein ACFQL4_06345 [Halosimplex aquaticum]
MERSLRRRSLLRAAGVAGAVALAGCPAGIGESTGFEPGEADWPSYRFDACNNGVHPSAPGPGGDLSLAWTATYREDAGAVPGMGQVSSRSSSTGRSRRRPTCRPERPPRRSSPRSVWRAANAAGNARFP